MRGISSLLGSDDFEGFDAVTRITTEIELYVRIASTVFLAICGLLVTIFAVYIGYKFAKATDDGQRQQAKQQLIYSIVGAVGIIMVIIIFNTIVGGNGVLGTDINQLEEQIAETSGELNTVVMGTYAAAQSLVNTVLQIIATVATVFAVWVGWQLMKAEDDGKRKQAKTQLIYTFIGIIAVVLINVIVTAVLGVMIDNALNGTSTE